MFILPDFYSDFELQYMTVHNYSSHACGAAMIFFCLLLNVVDMNT